MFVVVSVRQRVRSSSRDGLYLYILVELFRNARCRVCRSAEWIGARLHDSAWHSSLLSTVTDILLPLAFLGVTSVTL